MPQQQSNSGAQQLQRRRLKGPGAQGAKSSQAMSYAQRSAAARRPRSPLGASTPACPVLGIAPPSAARPAKLSLAPLLGRPFGLLPAWKKIYGTAEVGEMLANGLSWRRKNRGEADCTPWPSVGCVCGAGLGRGACGDLNVGAWWQRECEVAKASTLYNQI